MPYPLANRTPRGRTFLRRIVTVPTAMVAAVVMVVLFPVLVVVTALVDIVLRRWGFGTVRIVVFATWYLALGVWNQLVGLAIWVATGFGMRDQTDRAMRMHYWMIRLWIRLMLASLRRILGLRIEFDHPELAHGPAVIASRHTSLADVFIPTGVAIVNNGVWIRVVLTSGLVNEPSLDLVGHRSPHYFIQRQADNMRAEVEALVRLGAHTDDNTAMVIFPEGGLYREERRAKIVARLEEKDPEQAERGRRLRHLLPAKSAGFSALLDGSPSSDVVIVGHTGFEQLTNGRTIWRSLPCKDPALVTIRRFPRADVPEDAEGRKQWLNDRWDEMDEWIAQHRAGAGRERENSTHGDER